MTKGQVSKDDLHKAKAALEKAMEEAWEKLEHSIHETAGVETAGIALFVRYKPGRETKKKSIPPRIEIGGKMGLPTNKEVFAARDSGGQLTLSAWYGGE